MARDGGAIAAPWAGLPRPSNSPPHDSLSIVYEPVESGWVQARIEGIPEVITADRTKDEARELVLDALREYLASIENGDAAERERVDLADRRG